MNYSSVCRFVKNLWSKGDMYFEPYLLRISQPSTFIFVRTALADTTPMFVVLTVRRLQGRKHFFYPILPDFRKSTPLVEGSFASNVSPTKSSTTIHMSMEHLSNDTDMKEVKQSKEKTVPVPLCRPHVSHGLAWNQIWAPALRNTR